MKHTFSFRFYIGVVFIVSYLWQMGILFTGGVESKLFPFLMFFPGLVTIVIRLLNREGLRNIGWGLRKWWYCLPAVFIPLLGTAGIVALLEYWEWASLSVFSFDQHMLVDSQVWLLLGTDSQGIAMFAFNLCLTYIIICVIGSPFALGEECAWQGHLLQKLLRRFGLNRGLLFLGLIWGYWHFPVVLMGYNFPNLPVLGAFILMPLSTVFVGIFQGWLYLRSKSIWMPVMAHAASNAAAGVLFGGMVMHQDELYRQLLWLIGWGIVAVICLVSLHLKKPTLWQERDYFDETSASVVFGGYGEVYS